jgi:hypothetical protein
MSTAAKTRKPKSPAAPSRSLKGAFEDVKTLYAEYSHASFNRSEIASTLDMSATSGPFSVRLYTLRAYGLLESDGNAFRVSEAFRSLEATSPGDAEFKRHALAAIRRSEVFREVLDEFPSKLPARASVAQRLETEKRFNREKSIVVARALEESLKFAGLLDSSNNVMPIRDSGAKRDGETQTDQTNREVRDQPDDTVDSPALLRTEVPVNDGRRVVVHYPADLTGDEAQKVGNVLTAIVG